MVKAEEPGENDGKKSQVEHANEDENNDEAKGQENEAVEGQIEEKKSKVIGAKMRKRDGKGALKTLTLS